MLEIAHIVSEPDVCSYLPDRLARMEYRLVGEISPEEWAAELRSGVRRFGMALFRTACEGCRECIPIRVPVERFRPSRSQRRVLRRNRDVRVEVGPPGVDEERLALHRAFHRERTARVGWRPQEITPEDYSRTFVQNVVPTLELRYRVEGRLAALAYLDRSPAGLNSIYCMHHPDFLRRSLGTFDILMEIELAARLGAPHLYLGYFVAGCRSMTYKASFHPCELLREGEWRDEFQPAGW